MTHSVTRHWALPTRVHCTMNDEMMMGVLKQSVGTCCLYHFRISFTIQGANWILLHILRWVSLLPPFVITVAPVERRELAVGSLLSSSL